MTTAMTRIARLITGAVDELFPSAVDGQWDQALNNGWRVDGFDAYCHRCGATIGPGASTEKGCAKCFGKRLPWHGCVRLGPYRDPLRGWLLSFKYYGRWRWARRLGGAMAQRASECAANLELPGQVAVAPVPIHPLRRWRRGYNQAGMLASCVAREMRLPCVDLLKRSRYRKSQTHVAFSDRVANTRGSFAAVDLDLTGWGVWLVDDVKTSGATLNACARLLRRSGAAWIGVLVVAVAEPHEHAL